MKHSILNYYKRIFLCICAIIPTLIIANNTPAPTVTTTIALTEVVLAKGVVVSAIAKVVDGKIVEECISINQVLDTSLCNADMLAQVSPVNPDQQNFKYIEFTTSSPQISTQEQTSEAPTQQPLTLSPTTKNIIKFVVDDYKKTWKEHTQNGTTWNMHDSGFMYSYQAAHQAPTSITQHTERGLQRYLTLLHDPAVLSHCNYTIDCFSRLNAADPVQRVEAALDLLDLKPGGMYPREFKQVKNKILCTLYENDGTLHAGIAHHPIKSIQKTSLKFAKKFAKEDVLEKTNLYNKTKSFSCKKSTPDRSTVFNNKKNTLYRQLINAGKKFDMDAVRSIAQKNQDDKIVSVLSKEFEQRFHNKFYTPDGIIRVGLNDPLYKDLVQQTDIKNLSPTQKDGLNQNLIIRNELKKSLCERWDISKRSCTPTVEKALYRLMGTDGSPLSSLDNFIATTENILAKTASWHEYKELMHAFYTKDGLLKEVIRQVPQTATPQSRSTLLCQPEYAHERLLFNQLACLKHRYDDPLKTNAAQTGLEYVHQACINTSPKLQKLYLDLAQQTHNAIKQSNAPVLEIPNFATSYTNPAQQKLHETILAYANEVIELRNNIYNGQFYSKKAHITENDILKACDTFLQKLEHVHELNRAGELHKAQGHLLVAELESIPEQTIGTLNPDIIYYAQHHPHELAAVLDNYIIADNTIDALNTPSLAFDKFEPTYTFSEPSTGLKRDLSPEEMQRIEKVGKIIYGISRGVGDGVIDVGEEFKKFLTSPKQYAREIKDSLVTLVDNYDAQKRAIHNACTGDFSRVNELLTDVPESLKKYYTKDLPQHYRIEYLEMQPTKQDIEAWVVETILWDKRVDATWQALKEMPAEDAVYHISKTATEIIVTDKVISVAGKVVGTTCSTVLNKGGQMLDKAMAGAAKVGEYIEQAIVDEKKVEVAGTGLKVPENFFKTTEEVVTHSPKMEIVKDVSKGGAKVAKEVKKGTVWEIIKPTQSYYPGTKIPKSFELHLENGRFWVHPNGTKHMKEFFKNKAPSFSIPIDSQTLLTDFANTLELAIEKGFEYDTIFTLRKWELKIGAPREKGLLPTVFHALYIP